MRIALFGPPGAGKGTQATYLFEKYGVRTLSTGNLVRSEIRNEGPLGPKLASFIHDGGLVPDSIVEDLFTEKIAQFEFDQFILDGFPRTIPQAEWLTNFLDAHKAPLRKVISLSVPEEETIERLSGRRIHKLTCEPFHIVHNPPPSHIPPHLIVQRLDDRPESVTERLAVYKTVTAPIEAYYEERGLLAKVSGVGSPAKVHQRIIEALVSNSILEWA